VDTTAAGDVFVGYFVAGVARGYRLESALTLAAQAAALSVTRMGAAASIPTFDEVERFIAARAG
jgi:ribokinase